MSVERTPRTCGSCTACCKTHSVEDQNFSKPAGQWCKECVPGKGCAVYTNRPLACALFKCEWLKGRGTDDQRPDKTRVVLDYVRDHPISSGKGVLQMYELSEGALKKEYPKGELNLALDKGVTVIHKTARGNIVVFKPQQ